MKKKISILIVCILLLSVTVFAFVGCGKKKDFNYFGIAASVSDEELNNNDTAKMIKEYTGYNVKFAQQSADASTAQSEVMSIFNNKMDYQAVKVTKQQFYSLLSQGGLMDITEYVNESTNLKSSVGAFGWEMASKDGKIYGVPQKDAKSANNVAIAFRLDWLNEYNANNDPDIPVPSEANGYSMSTSNYKKMLEYFKTKVGSNGKAMRVGVNGVYLESILPAFGIYQEWADVNGKLTYVVNQPGFENYLSYMQGLVDAGVVGYQATSGDKTVVNSLKDGSAGAGRVAHWEAAAVEGAAGDDKISYIQALVPSDGAAVRSFAAEGYGYFTVIPKHTSKKEAKMVIDYIDKKLDADFFKKMVIGEEGVHYEVKNGEYYPLLPKFDEKGIADKYTDGTREADYEKYWMARVRKTTAQYKMFSIANYNISSTGIKNPITVMPPNDLYDKKQTAADTAAKEELVKAMYGAASSRPTLDSIKAKYNTEKEGTAITESVNAWYKDWNQKDNYNSVKPR